MQRKSKTADAMKEAKRAREKTRTPEEAIVNMLRLAAFGRALAREAKRDD